MTPSFTHEGLSQERAELFEVAQGLFAGAREDEWGGVDLGFFGIGIPEADGGAGGVFADLAPVVEAAGASLSATAAVWSAGLAAPMILDNAAEFRGILSDLASGGASVAVPVGQPWRIATEHMPSSTRPDLSGSVLTIGPTTPSHLLLPLLRGSTQAIAVLPLAHDAAYVEPVSSIDQTRSFCRVTVTGYPIDDAVGIVEGNDLFRAWRARIGLLSALDAVGTARIALQRTITYASERRQFGRPIGSFQAYKHRCASAYIELRLGQSLAFRAAESFDSEEGINLALSAAITSTASATHICGEAVQLHGGIGFTWEAGLHAHLKRARTDEIIAKGGTEASRLLLVGFQNEG